MDGVQKQMMRCVVVSLQRVEDFLTIAHGDGEFEATRGLPWPIWQPESGSSTCMWGSSRINCNQALL